MQIIRLGEPLLTNTVHQEFSEIVPPSINIKIYKDFTFEELKDTISELPKTTAIFFIPVTKDRNDTTVIPKNLLSELTQISGAPIYTIWGTLTGTGCVGGEMLSAQKTSQGLLAGLQTYLETDSFDTSY
ncbi:MAG: hypothetical protein GX220_02180 [Treponema sp.]|jgi:hypothetical protein|nr:hypothetical protein [Treponema sp.]